MASPNTAPPATTKTKKGFPSEVDFQAQVAEYIAALNPKKRGKALMSREMYESVVNVLLYPRETKESSAQWRFWCRKTFRLHSTPTAHIVLHENRPVATSCQIYAILVSCHGASSHGGRDKTSAQVRRYYSWIPKELVARFVRICPRCTEKRRQGRLTLDPAECDDDDDDDEEGGIEDVGLENQDPDAEYRPRPTASRAPKPTARQPQEAFEFTFPAVSAPPSSSHLSQLQHHHQLAPEDSFDPRTVESSGSDTSLSALSALELSALSHAHLHPPTHQHSQLAHPQPFVAFPSSSYFDSAAFLERRPSTTSTISNGDESIDTPTTDVYSLPPCPTTSTTWEQEEVERVLEGLGEEFHALFRPPVRVEGEGAKKPWGEAYYAGGAPLVPFGPPDARLLDQQQQQQPHEHHQQQQDDDAWLTNAFFRLAPTSSSSAAVATATASQQQDQQVVEGFGGTGFPSLPHHQHQQQLGQGEQRRASPRRPAPRPLQLGNASNLSLFPSSSAAGSTGYAPAMASAMPQLYGASTGGGGEDWTMGGGMHHHQQQHHQQQMPLSAPPRFDAPIGAGWPEQQHNSLGLANLPVPGAVAYGFDTPPHSSSSSSSAAAAAAAVAVHSSGMAGMMRYTHSSPVSSLRSQPAQLQLPATPQHHHQQQGGLKKWHDSPLGREALAFSIQSLLDNVARDPEPAPSSAAATAALTAEEGDLDVNDNEEDEDADGEMMLDCDIVPASSSTVRPSATLLDSPYTSTVRGGSGETTLKRARTLSDALDTDGRWASEALFPTSEERAYASWGAAGAAEEVGRLLMTPTRGGAGGGY